jgi:hypothetical protein
MKTAPYVAPLLSGSFHAFAVFLLPFGILSFLKSFFRYLNKLHSFGLLLYFVL